MNPHLHPEEIKFRIRMRHGSLAQFEKNKGLPMHSVSFVLSGRAILPTAEAIADELDIPLHQVSSLYHGQYYRLSTTPRHRTKPQFAHPRNGKAA